MPIRSAETRVSRAKRATLGFTLLELMVALAVMGVATTIYIKLYNSSLSLAKTSVNHRIATQLATEQLNAMQQRPDQFLWNISAPGADERFSVTLGPDDPKAGNPVQLPAAMPAEMRALRAEESRYAPFRWQAFGELRHNAAYYDLTVVVRWTEEGNEKMLAITSAITREKVDIVRRQQAPPPTVEEVEEPVDGEDAGEAPEADSDEAVETPEVDAGEAAA